MSGVLGFWSLSRKDIWLEEGRKEGRGGREGWREEGRKQGRKEKL